MNVCGLFKRPPGLGLICAVIIGSPAAARAEEPKQAEPAAARPMRLFLRGDGLLTFSVRGRHSSRETPSFCVAPCDARLVPGDYELRLNGVVADPSFSLRRSGTLEGRFHSREASRSAGWLALNLGGIIGGVFLTVGALGGSSWTYIAGGGSLATAGVIFAVTYRADTASVSFVPSEPLDVRGMPEPEPLASSGLLAVPDGQSLGSQARGLGFRVVF